MKLPVLSSMGRRTAAPPVLWLMRMAVEHPQVISLAAGLTDSESLPIQEVRRALRALLGSVPDAQAALQYGATNGDAQLRRLTAERVRQQDQILQGGAAAYAPDRFLITHGSQQFLYLVTEVLCDPGDVVLVEAPTYYVYLGVAQSFGLRCQSIPLEADGIDLKHLEQVLERLKRRGDLARTKMLYLISYFQNPTSTTTSIAKKAGILELLRQYERAAGHPIYLLEDAAYRDLRFRGESPASALSVAGADRRVIYTGTYSKPFSTGIRLGYGCLPEPLLAVVMRLKGNHDFGTANFLQQLLLRVLTSGQYDDHLRTLRRRYAHKAETMVSALRDHFPASVQWEAPAGGLYVWALLPADVNAGLKSKLLRAALAERVLYVPGEICYAPDPACPPLKHGLRLSFGSASEVDIREGIARLGRVIRRFL